MKDCYPHYIDKELNVRGQVTFLKGYNWTDTHQHAFPGSKALSCCVPVEVDRYKLNFGYIIDRMATDAARKSS